MWSTPPRFCFLLYRLHLLFLCLNLGLSPVVGYCLVFLHLGSSFSTTVCSALSAGRYHFAQHSSLRLAFFSTSPYHSVVSSIFASSLHLPYFSSHFSYSSLRLFLLSQATSQQFSQPALWPLIRATYSSHLAEDDSANSQVCLVVVDNARHDLSPSHKFDLTG